MKINEQTQDLSDFMQNFFKKKTLKYYRTKTKRCNILMSTFVLFFWGGGMLSCIS